MIATALAAGLAQPGEHRRLLAEVAAQREVAEPRVRGGDLAQHREGAVAAAVVDEDHLEVSATVGSTCRARRPAPGAPPPR